MREQIGRYRILGVLGEGGMGVVYAAEDEVLRRKVAIKTVRPDAADPSHRERLWREARAAAGLAHPGVCQVYDVREDGSELYIAMELLEGEPLGDRLRRGPLPLCDALRVALDILAALDALHARDVIHRDLKPSNVFLTPQGSKLLDFGLALPLGEALTSTQERLTQSGMILGTPGFMAPEQWSGESVGPRTDVFAVGALIHEMATGAPTFAGRNAMEVYHAVMHESPATLTGGPAVDALDRVVQRALSRDPAERYPTASDMAEDLATVVPLVEGQERPQARTMLRVLVVPFDQPRSDEMTQLCALGITDTLLTALAGHHGLVVRAGKAGLEPEELTATAKEHGIHVVVTGSVLRAGSKLRISARLLAMPEGDVAWSRATVVDGDDPFEAQEELAGRVGTAIVEHASLDTGSTMRSRVPTSPEAYALFLRANQQSYNFGLLGESRDLYRAALAIDPGFAPAWARLGRVLRVRAKYGHGDTERERVEAKEAFERALELDPDLAVAHNFYAYFEIEELGRPEDAMSRLLRQVRRAPTDPDLFAGLVTACRFCGLLDASIAADRRARRLDPGVRTSVAYTLWMAGDYEGAVRHDDEDMRWIHHYGLPMLGRTEEALQGLRACEARAPRPLERDMLVSSRATLEGDVDAALPAIQRLLQSSFRDPEGFYFAARDLAYLAQHELALDVLQRVVDGGLSCPTAFETDPWLAGLRGMDRFDALLAQAAERRARAARVYVESGGVAALGPLPIDLAAS